MPLTKRVLFSSSSFQPPVDALNEADTPPNVQLHSYSQVTGTIRQLAVLSSYSLEIFTNLAVLTEDLHERMKTLSIRTNALLYKNLPEYDRCVRNSLILPDLSELCGTSVKDTFGSFHTTPVNMKKGGKLKKKKYLSAATRLVATPPIFVKSTNYPSILVQYKLLSKSVPQLWRIENIIGEDCFQFFSYPGYFFEEWLKVEIIKQELSKEQKRKEKALKKQLKKEQRKKLREGLALSTNMTAATELSRRLSGGIRRSTNYDRPKSLLTKDVAATEEKKLSPIEEELRALSRTSSRSGRNEFQEVSVSRLLVTQYFFLILLLLLTFFLFSVSHLLVVLLY
jgi:hypothetical protein